MNILIPWWAKIGLKIVLSRIPFSYSLWKKIGIFEHGKMNDNEFAFAIFNNHFRLAKPPSKFVCLELGNGDSLASGIIAKAYGAAKTYLVDIGDYAKKDLSLYKDLYALLRKKGCNFQVDFNDINSMLASCNASYYLTSGIHSLKKKYLTILLILFSRK